MRDNTRSSKERFELSLDARQALAVLVASLVVVAGVFVLGMSAGRAAAARVAPAAPKDALARLDEPLAAKDEPPPELKAHEALTAGKTIDGTLPARPPRLPPRRDEPAAAVEVSAPPQIPSDASAAPSGNGNLLTTSSSSTSPAPAKPSQARDPAPGRDERGQGSTPTSTSARTPTRTRTSTAGSAPHRGAFTIQVASAPRRADAQRVANTLAQRGARVVPADVPGKGRWYRVQIGDYPSREAASRQLASLSRAGVQGIVTATR